MKPFLIKTAVFFFAVFLLTSIPARADSRPNVVVLQTDDQSMRTLQSSYVSGNGKKLATMPNLKNLLINRGVSFNNHMAASPVCAPNRTSLISGRYSHSTKVVGNGGLYGGWEGWRASDAILNNFVVRLNQVGYNTAHFGKWTNYYGEGGDNSIPPGWDTWMTDATDESTRLFYGYEQLIKNRREGISGERTGEIGNINYTYTSRIDPKNCRPGMDMIDRCFYHTDRMSSFAGQEIILSSAEKKPFYIQIDYHAPHGDKIAPAGPQPATRHLFSADKTALPKTKSNPNYNENTDKTRTKPFLIRKNNGPISTRGYEATPLSYWRRGLESLRAVDDSLKHITDILKESGEYSNTYIIFTSDNGFFYGDHRFISAKFLAYQESAQLPLIIAGPGIPKGTTNTPSSTVDIGPTVLDLTNTSNGFYKTDGISLKNSVMQPRTHSTRDRSGSPYTNRAQIIEYISEEEMAGIPNFSIIPATPLSPNRRPAGAPALKYRAIKIGRFKYIDYDRTTNELYDLYSDPEELRNQIKNPKYKKIADHMAEQLKNYKDCSGSTCTAPPPLVPPIG